MHRPAQQGFTFIELLIVIAIIGLLATMVISSVTAVRERSRDTVRLHDIRQVINVLATWELDNTHFPCHADQSSIDPEFMRPYKDAGLLPEGFDDPTGDPFVYEYATFKRTPSGPCGQIVYLGMYTERFIHNCPSFGKVVGTNHCHIFYPEPLPCSDPYGLIDPEPPDCEALRDTASEDEY